MAELKATRLEKTYRADDGAKRGPMTMARLRFHPQTRRLLGQCVDRRLACWDLDGTPAKGNKGGEAVAAEMVCPHDAGWIRGFDLHPQGGWLATGGSDRRLKLWKWEGTGPAAAPAFDVAAHAGWVEAVAFSPDGARLATVGADRMLTLWDSAQLKAIRSTAAHAGYPRDLTFTPDGKFLVSGGEDGRALVWNAETLEQAGAIDTGLTSEQQGQNPSTGGILRLGVSHDGRWLAASCDRVTLVYELRTGHGVGSISDAGGDALFAHRGPVLAAGESTLRLWQLDPAKFAPKAVEVKTDSKGKTTIGKPAALAEKEFLQVKRGEFSFGAAFSADDGLFASGRTDGTVEVWTLA